MAKSGHFWAHLLHDNVVIKADDTIIQILPKANALQEANQNGCIFFYVKCTAGEDVDVVFCNEIPKHNMCEAIPLPLLTFLKETSAFKKCHKRLAVAAAQSPELFTLPLEKCNIANTSVSSVSLQCSVTDVCTLVKSFVEDILPAPFLGNDLLCLKSLSRYVCIQCGEQAVPSTTTHSQVTVQPLEVSQKGILDTVAHFPAQHGKCEACKQEKSLATYKVIHSPQTLLLLLTSGTEIPKTFTLSCLYQQNDYAVSSICAFSDRSPYVSLYTCKNQKWHIMTHESNDKGSYTFELMQQVLTDTPALNFVPMSLQSS